MNRHLNHLKNTIILISIGIIGTIFTACGDDEPAPELKPMAVIQGNITSGRYPVVVFSSSIIPDENGGSLKDVMVMWGKVTISDGEKTVIMSGGPNNGYMPPYRYFTYEMVGETGKTYTIEATYRDLKTTAITYVPEITPIDKVTVQKTEVDSLRAVTLHFTAPRDCPAYYYLTLVNRKDNLPPRPCLLGTITADKPGEKYSIAVMNPKYKIDGTKYVAQLKVGDEVSISLNRVEKRVFDFWRAYDNMLLFSSSPFVSSSESLPGNISGGFGILSGEGTSSYSLKVE